MERHYPPPVGSVDPNIRHQITVCDLMAATRRTYPTYIAGASTGVKGGWLPRSVIPSSAVLCEATQQPCHGSARLYVLKCFYPNIHEGYPSPLLHPRPLPPMWVFPTEPSRVFVVDELKSDLINCLSVETTRAIYTYGSRCPHTCISINILR